MKEEYNAMNSNKPSEEKHDWEEWYPLATK